MTPHKTFWLRTNQENSISRGHLSNQVGIYEKCQMVMFKTAHPCEGADCRLIELHPIGTMNTNNSKQCALYLVVLLLPAVDGGQQAIAFKAPSLLWHNVTGHLFSFFCLSHHGQNLSLQNHTDLGLDSTWLSSYQRNHSGNVSHKSAQHLFVTHREGWLTTVINNRL